jgi:hypothetical protein
MGVTLSAGCQNLEELVDFIADRNGSNPRQIFIGPPFFSRWNQPGGGLRTLNDRRGRWDRMPLDDLASLIGAPSNADVTSGPTSRKETGRSIVV